MIIIVLMLDKWKKTIQLVKVAIIVGFPIPIQITLKYKF